MPEAAAPAEEVPATHPPRPPICHDRTERPIPRPQDAIEQKTCSRGKNTRHMLKNLLLINRTLRTLFLSETHPGHVHDKRRASTAPSPLPAGSQLLQDLGFPALTPDGVEIIQPTKKPHGRRTRPIGSSRGGACASNMSTAA